MAVAGSEVIKDYIKKGIFVIRPFREEQVNGSSYDFRLGNVFFSQLEGGEVNDEICPYSNDDNDDEVPRNCWNPKPIIIDDDGYIVITAGETVLATSYEFMGARSGFTTMLRTKSTVARLGLDMGSALWGDPGFINRWAFPLTNRTNHDICLASKTLIGQIIFMSMVGDTVDYSQSGSYQSSNDIEEIMENWKPTDILPKLLKVAE